jgi:hypothetical protein
LEAVIGVALCRGGSKGAPQNGKSEKCKDFIAKIEHKSKSRRVYVLDEFEDGSIDHFISSHPFALAHVENFQTQYQY